MEHNAHLIDLESAGGLEVAARSSGFGDETVPAESLATVALRMDALDDAQVARLRQAAGDASLQPLLRPCATHEGGQRLFLAGDRRRFHALSAALQILDPALAPELDRLLQADARRHWSWSVRGRRLQAGPRTLVMGVLNITPDSFSDGGRHTDPGRAVEHGLEMVEAGADLVDVGGESTRPGAARVSAAEESERVLPVIRALARQSDVTLSVDTSRAAVAAQALEAGARVVNDISALGFDDAMADVVAESRAGLVMMHMQGAPPSMQQAPAYHDVLAEVLAHLREALDRALGAGITPEQVVLDPGIGFGKGLEHNLTLLRHAGSLRALGRPVLVGTSRKAFVGQITGRPVEQRLAGSLGSLAAAVTSGAALVRVHDVAETVDCLSTLQAIRGGECK